jgi:hypothetical protein
MKKFHAGIIINKNKRASSVNSIYWIVDENFKLIKTGKAYTKDGSYHSKSFAKLLLKYNLENEYQLTNYDKNLSLEENISLAIKEAEKFYNIDKQLKENKNHFKLSESDIDDIIQKVLNENNDD